MLRIRRPWWLGAVALIAVMGSLAAPRVAIGDVNGDGRKATAIRAYDGRTFVEISRFPAFDATFNKGVFVAGVRR